MDPSTVLQLGKQSSWRDGAVKPTELYRQSQQISFLIKPQFVRKDDDYFAADDTAIRSPTYYKKESLGLNSTAQSTNADITSMLRPTELEQKQAEEEEAKTLQGPSGTFGSEIQEDDQMEFDKKVE
jgi:hypothetical protein